MTDWRGLWIAGALRGYLADGVESPGSIRLATANVLTVCGEHQVVERQFDPRALTNIPRPVTHIMAMLINVGRCHQVRNSPHWANAWIIARPPRTTHHGRPWSGHTAMANAAQMLSAVSSVAPATAKTPIPRSAQVHHGVARPYLFDNPNAIVASNNHAQGHHNPTDAPKKWTWNKWTKATTSHTTATAVPT